MAALAILIETNCSRKKLHTNTFSLTFALFLRFLGVLDPLKTDLAEMIPVEPEQGNACAGKVFKTIPLFYLH